jgi:hypothetical protein
MPLKVCRLCGQLHDARFGCKCASMVSYADTVAATHAYMDAKGWTYYDKPPEPILTEGERKDIAELERLFKLEDTRG